MPVSFRRQIYLVSLENHFMQFAVILVILGEFFKYYLYSLEYAEKYTQSAVIIYIFLCKLFQKQPDGVL